MAKRADPAPAPIDSLRERLIAMRDALVEGLAGAEHLDGGLLRLLGDVGSALQALDDLQVSRR